MQEMWKMSGLAKGRGEEGRREGGKGSGRGRSMEDVLTAIQVIEGYERMHVIYVSNV